MTDLSNKFSSSLWSDKSLWSSDSEFRRFLRMLPGSDGEMVSKDSMLSLGILWCQVDLYNKAECLFELITSSKQTDDAPKNVIMYSDKVDDQSDPELARHSEMWELILLTLFEIASVTIPTFLDKNRPYDRQLWTEAAKALQYSETETENDVKIIPYVEQVSEDAPMTFTAAENTNEEKNFTIVETDQQIEQLNKSNSHEYSSAHSQLSKNRLNEHQVDQILKKNSANFNLKKNSETAAPARDESSQKQQGFLNLLFCDE